MSRPKGLPKTGGRKKGTPNKREALGQDRLERLVGLMEDEDRVKEELEKLHGKDFFRVYLDALQYLRPKMSNVEYRGNVAVSNVVAERLREVIGCGGDVPEE